MDDPDVRETAKFNTLKMPKDDSYTTQARTPTERAESKKRFTILRLHQKGGLGRVSIALDEELNREIALKEILSAHADNQENRARFVREAEITGALEHPGVVPVYSLGQFADGRPYYAMRFIRGVNLQLAIEDFHALEEGSSAEQLQFRQLLGNFVDVCNAIEYAHSRGVIHRDLKPSNIMLGDYGETLVVDWGLAKSLGDGFATDESILAPVHTSKRASSTSTRVGRVVGTPPYMSPEQAAGRLDAMGACSDIYSLGATLYHLLTGQVAFNGTEEEVVGNVQMGRFPRPRSISKRIPRSLEAICLKAMARMPNDRYATARALAEDIERYLADERVIAYVEPFPARTWRWIHNHKPLVISTSAALTVAFAALSISVVMLSATNVRERTLRDEATLNYKEAERQRKNTERNFGLARDAVRQYYVTVSEETLLDQPGMQPLRDNLLRQALEYYRSFSDERQDDPTLSEEVAQSQFFTGKITQIIDSPAKALPHYEEAGRLLESLLQDSLEDRELLANFGSALNAIGDVQLRLGELKKAQQQFQLAVDVRERLAKSNSDDWEAARTLANSVMNVGFVLSLQRNFDEAVRRVQHAQALRTAHLSQQDQADSKLHEDMGKGYYLLGVTWNAVGDVVIAETNFLAAIDVFQELLDSAPHQMAYQRQLAASQRLLGDLKSAEQDTEKAIVYYEVAKSALEELRIRNPDVMEFSSDLAGVYMNLG